MIRPSSCCLSLILLGVVASAQQPQSNWVGKTIILKRADVELTGADKEGNNVRLAKLDQASCVVLAEENGRLKVKSWRGVEGWFAKDDAVLLDDAVASARMVRKFP